MTKIARYGRAKAKPGKGGELADLLLAVARQLEGFPGCELYLINQQADDPDTVWVTERWTDQAAMDGALAAAHEAEDGPKPADALALVEPGQWQMIELTPRGGLGPRRGADGYARVRLDDVEDMAAKHGFGETGEARFPNEELGLGPIGVSLQSLRPGKRQQFGHRHANDEEVYVVLSGSGTMRVGDDEIAVSARDAIRVGPRVPRAFEAGDAGLEFLAFGERRPGDAEMLPGWWG